MKQNRREFLKKLPLAMSIPFALGGIPLRAMAEDNALTRMAKASFDNPRVLVILQMHGGNDGLNTLIPVKNYEEYFSRRPNIAIPRKNSSRKYIELDSTLPLDAQVGLHPDMAAMKAMYDIGRVSIVQGVSYKNNSGSHFRGRDIQFMGGSAEDYLSSGWIGRYMDRELPSGLSYPEDFPNEQYPDPLAIEMGNDVSLIFHQAGNIPVSISINDPQGFANLIEELEGFQEAGVDPRGLPPSPLLDNSPYYNELKWILSLEDKSKDYSKRMADVYNMGGETSVTYPENYPFNAPDGSYRNRLSPQLKLIARMLGSNVCKTKVFLVKIGGFDTHADQVENYNSTLGSHAALLYHITTAMKAFQEDLRARGIEQNVLTVTTSEFGRRIGSNGSYGTDHGTGGPIFVFGSGVKPGLSQKNEIDLSLSNVALQYDYRQVYASIVRDWLLNEYDDTTAKEKLDVIFPGLTTTGTSDDVLFDEDLKLAQQVITGSEGFVSSRFTLRDCYPNPTKGKTVFSFRVNAANNVSLDLLDGNGKKVKVITNKQYAPGDHEVTENLSDLPSGNYVYELRSGSFKQAKKLVIIK
ncbi:MAG TPA: DUF1501 domain-containing protein [Ohtaekwangia sp.]|nr:DUF1501 domain-containing protein [Ohtaekwangia sp.]